jgi:tRNA A-37 threonylcarbamoyl transferase component Bud32
VNRVINPYLNRTAIRDDRGFFGRSRELVTMFSRIDAGEPQSVSVVGERRIGKSSLLRALLRRKQLFLRRPDEYVFVSVDLHEKVHGEISHFFAVLIEGLALSLQDTNVSKTAPTYEGIRGAVAQIDRSRLKLVFVLDEFEAVTQNENFTLEFFSFLRSLPNNYSVSFIVSSARELQDLCHSKEVSGSPFFNIFHKLNLGSFTPEEAADLIAQPSEAAGYPLKPYASSIIRMGGYFPFFLQMACCTFFESRNGSGDDIEPDLEQIRTRFYEEALGHFEYVWDHLTDRQRTACSRLSERHELNEQDRSFVGGLIRRGYVYEQKGDVRLFSDVFEDFVKEKTARVLSTESPTMRAIEGTGAELIGKTVARFTIREVLGRGGMGEVYLAKDTKLKRFVALKRIATHLRDDPNYRRRFLNEAERASQLNHRCIVRIYDVVEDGLDVFLIMEYVEGTTLRTRIGAIRLEDLLNIARQCAAALAVAHQNGIVHCDIKPENILITPEGEVKILDFGVAKHLPHRDGDGMTLTPDQSLSRVMGGTPAYMSPEVFLEHMPDARADIFSLGVVLYELWTGQHPFRSSTTIETANRVLQASPNRLSNFISDTPDELENVIEKCLSKNPDDRYQTALELLADLTKIAVYNSRPNASGH